MSTYEANRYNFTGANVTGIPTSAITSGTFADARLSSSSVTQHVDLSNLNASNLTSGTIPDARVGSSSVTQHVTSISQTSGSWTPTATGNGFVSGSAYGRYFKIGKLVYVVGRWTIPTGHTGSSGSGIGALSTSQFKISGLPFTAANTSNPVLNATGSHCLISAQLGNSLISVVVYHNTSEMRFFGGTVTYNSSYSRSGGAGSISTGYELSVGNVAIGNNDDDKNKGSCSFMYYTD